MFAAHACDSEVASGIVVARKLGAFADSSNALWGVLADWHAKLTGRVKLRLEVGL